MNHSEMLFFLVQCMPGSKPWMMYKLSLCYFQICKGKLFFFQLFTIERPVPLHLI